MLLTLQIAFSIWLGALAVFATITVWIEGQRRWQQYKNRRRSGARGMAR